MLPNVVRRMIPEQSREDLSIAILKKVGWCRFGYWFYAQILCDGYPKGLQFLPNWEFGYEYKGHQVRVPRDGGIVIRESFQENLYEYYPINQGDVVLDIGAYVGTFTLKALLGVGDTGKVIAVEPVKENMKYCKINCKGFDNVEFVRKVISNRNGIVKLYISEGSACHTLVYPHNKSVKIKSVTIDSLVDELKLDRVDLIKLDIEGANLMALEGAEETLKRPEVKLAIAAYHKQPNGEPEKEYIKKFLKDRGFNLHEEREYVYAKKE